MAPNTEFGGVRHHSRRGRAWHASEGTARRSPDHAIERSLDASGVTTCNSEFIEGYGQIAPEALECGNRGIVNTEIGAS